MGVLIASTWDIWNYCNLHTKEETNYGLEFSRMKELGKKKELEDPFKTKKQGKPSLNHFGLWIGLAYTQPTKNWKC